MECESHDVAWWVYTKVTAAIKGSCSSQPLDLSKVDADTHKRNSGDMEIGVNINEASSSDIYDNNSKLRSVMDALDPPTDNNRNGSVDIDEPLTKSKKTVAGDILAVDAETQRHVLQTLAVTWTKSTWYKNKEAKARQMEILKFDLMNLSEKSVDLDDLEKNSLSNATL